MEQLTLRKPTINDINLINDFKTELEINKSSWDGTSDLKNYDDISKWLIWVENKESKETCPPYLVTSTQYIFVKDENKIIGMVNVRHNLNENNKTIGGHIGYSIVPSERNKGYGTLQLKYTLEKCKELGLEKVLITCNSKNIASKEIIIKNNGIFENNIISCDDIFERYWIDIC